MKSILQLIVSVVVGTMLGISVYNRLLVKNQTEQATNIEVDLSLLSEDNDLTRKRIEADSIAYVKYQDSLQRTLILIESEPPKPHHKSVISQADGIDGIQQKPVIRAKKRVGIQPKIELHDIKKPVAPAVPMAEFQSHEKTEIASTIKSVASTESDAIDTNGAAQTQPQPEKKKKFLFFNKRNNTN